MEWDIVSVKMVAPLAIEVKFTDGTKGKVKFEKTHLTGVFEILKNPDVFKKVFIDDGVVAWPGNIDLAPDAMYAAIQAKGEWILV